MPIITTVSATPPTTPPVDLPEIGAATATYIDPAGGVWPLTDPKRGWFTLADGVSGLGATPMELTTDAHPRGGARVRHVQPQPRDIVWPLHVWADGHGPFVSRWRQLARAFTRTSRDGPGVVEIARPDGGRRRINVYYRDGWEAENTRGDSIDGTAVVTFFCEDPYWTDPLPRSVHREYAVGEDYLQPYPSVSSGQVLGATTVDNPGDVIVWPEWTITGPATLVTFTNSGTGEVFTLDPTLVGGSLLATEEVTVTTDPPRVRKRTAEVQTINLGGATAGTITITVEGQTTGSIAYNADAATVQAALDALSNVEPGDITVTGGPLPATISLSFAGQYLGVDVPEVTVTPSGLTDGTVTVATTTTGSTDNWVGALNWPGARLWGLPPGESAVTFQLDGSGPGSSVDLTFYPRYETA